MASGRLLIVAVTTASIAVGCGAAPRGAAPSSSSPGSVGELTYPFSERVAQRMGPIRVSARTRHEVLMGCRPIRAEDPAVVDCGEGAVVLSAPVVEVVYAHEVPRLTCFVGCAHSSHRCALLQTGAVECWGDRFVGQLGDGTELQEPRLTPMPVHGLPVVEDIDSGPGHVCAIGRDASVWCWGSNIEGQLGDGGTTTQTRPVRVLGLDGLRPAALALGSYHSCALLEDGRVVCWGAPWAFGERGPRRTAQVLSLPRPVIELFAGEDVTCVLDDRGAVWCGGYDLPAATAP